MSDIKARVSFLPLLLDPTNLKSKNNRCVHIKAAIGFYETGFEGFLTMYIYC